MSDTTLRLSRQQVRDIDRWAIETIGVNSLVLMENAGRQCADEARRMLAAMSVAGSGGGVAIVAGGGNNGGDGFVIARHLANRGCRVTTFLVVAESKLTPDAAENLKILRNLKHDVRVLGGADLPSLCEQLRQFDLVVDAIGGTGVTGPLRGEPAAAVEQVNQAGRSVLAVDIPTGLDCDTGLAMGPTIRAAATVTFVAIKKGFDTPGADQYTGRVVVADIGVVPQNE